MSWHSTAPLRPISATPKPHNHSKLCQTKLLGISQRHVRPQPNHPYPRRDPLSTAESRAVLELAPQRTRENHHDKIGGRVQKHGDHSENRKLPKNVAALRHDELWNE